MNLNDAYNDLDEVYNEEIKEDSFQDNIYDDAERIMNNIKKYIMKYHICYYDAYFDYINNNNVFKYRTSKTVREMVLKINEEIKQMIINKTFKCLK